MKQRSQKHRSGGKVLLAIVLGVLVCVFSAWLPVVVGELTQAPPATESVEALPAAVPGGNNALFFDGVNDYLEIPEIAAIRADKSEPLTVEFWVHIRSYGKKWHKVLSKWGARGGDDDEFVVVFRQDGTFGFADTGSTGLGSRILLPANVWFHFCCVWDDVNGERKLYINGELIPQYLNGGAALRLTGEPIRIGTDGHRNQCFKGMIDEVRLWNVARTQEDVRATMKRKLLGDEPGLVGCWDFDEGTGQIVYDLSASGNRGRLGRLPVPDDADPVWVASGVELYEPLGSAR